MQKKSMGEEWQIYQEGTNFDLWWWTIFYFTENKEGISQAQQIQTSDAVKS